MQSKMASLKDDVAELQKDFKEANNKYVTFNHLEDIIEPMQGQVIEIQRDIKRILMILSKNDQGFRSSRKTSD